MAVTTPESEFSSKKKKKNLQMHRTVSGLLKFAKNRSTRPKLQ